MFDDVAKYLVTTVSSGEFTFHSYFQLAANLFLVIFTSKRLAARVYAKLGQKALIKDFHRFAF